MSDDLPPFPRTMLTIEQVLAIVPLARTTLFRLERRGQFPRAAILEGAVKRKLWYADDVARWQQGLPWDRVKIEKGAA